MNKLAILLILPLTIGCAYGKNYTHQKADGNYIHGTDHNTVHLLSKGSHSNEEWNCPTEEFNRSDCMDRGLLRRAENTPVMSILAAPLTGMTYGLTRKSDNNSNSANQSQMQRQSSGMRGMRGWTAD